MRRFPSPTHTSKKMAKKRSGNPRKRKQKQRSAKSSKRDLEKLAQPQLGENFERKVTLERISKSLSKHDETLLDCFLFPLSAMRAFSEADDDSFSHFEERPDCIMEMMFGAESRVAKIMLEQRKQIEAWKTSGALVDAPFKEVACTFLEDAATKLLELNIQDHEILPSELD